MWIVRLALRRPYTFVVAAMLVMILGIVTIVRMPTDIFPDIEIPVISVVFNYTGMSADDMEKRIVTQYEQFLTTTVNDIEHIESQSLYGIGVLKIYFQKNAKIEAAVAQVTAVSQTAIRIMPPGTQPPLVIQYSASNVPVIQLALSSDVVPEQEMFDQAINVLRRGLITVKGVQIPYPYGGRQRQVMVDLDPEKLFAYGISPSDVSAAINSQNLILPAGTVKIGRHESQVILNSSPSNVSAINDMPIKTVTNPDGTATPIYIKDVAHVRDGFQVQTNVVHSDGKRGVLLSILKNGQASTLDVVNGVKAALPDVQKGMNKDLKITPLFDQSVFVRASVNGVIREAAIAAGLTALMILLFLGSWRSTLIVVISIPLSILVSIITLAALGETLNVMTLGGMALAVGILVDDATVEIENIHRNLHQRKRLVQAILDGASQIAVPAFVSTICICIVFVPVVFISGAAKYLFTPLAMAVVFAMLTSYLLSRTLVPTMVHYLLATEVEMYGGEIDENDPRERQKEEEAHEKPNRFRLWLRKPWAKLVLLVGVPLLVVTLILVLNAVGAGRKFAGIHAASDHFKAVGGWIAHHPLTALVWLATLVAAGVLFWLIGKYNVIWRVHNRFNAGFEKVRRGYGGLLVWALGNRGAFVGFFLVIVVVSLFLFPFVGNDFFPSVDAGQIRMHIRAPAGTRIEETEKIFARVEEAMKKDIPGEEIDILLDNMGIPNSGINLSLSEGTQISPADGEVMVALKPGHKPTEQYIEKLRHHMSEEFPEVTVFFSPADIATQVLNFGLSAPIDVQIDGPVKDAPANGQLALQMQSELASIPGVADPHLLQTAHTPDIRVDVDRTLANQLGLAQKDVASDLLISLSSSNQTAPNFWLNPQNGVNYSILVQTPQYRINTLNDLENTPIVPTLARQNGNSEATQLLGNLATIKRAASATNITHYNIRPTFDIGLNIAGSDLGRVADGVREVVDKYRPKLPPGSHLTLRGQIESMHASFTGLAYGLIFAVLLVYLLLVINFQSWIDPLIILMALPGAIAGILWMLWATGTTLSVPALMGAIMSIGVATANSILMITFANDKREEGMNAHDAALAAGLTRLRPVIMTALAMIIGMLPMSLGLGEGGEQNAPLGRAVIGGLTMATFATLFFVPIVYSVLRKHAAVTQMEEELQ